MKKFKFPIRLLLVGFLVFSTLSIFPQTAELTCRRTRLTVWVSEFLAYQQEVAAQIKSGQYHVRVFGQVREIVLDKPTPGMGMAWIYEQDNARIVSEYRDNLEYYLNTLTQSERNHDFPAFLGLVAESFPGDVNVTDKDVYSIFISDGGFKTRAGISTLAYGYNGVVTLPGGKVFKDLQVPMGFSILQMLEEGREGFAKDYLAWIASDNFLLPGAMNWNGKDLNEIPKDAKVILSGAKVELLNDEEKEKIGELIGENEDWSKVAAAINGHAFEHFRSIVEEHKIRELGVFAVKEGRVSGFAEKIQDLADIARFAYEKGEGAVYKNAFTVLLNKDTVASIYTELSNIKMFQDSEKTLDNLAVSFFQTMSQGHFTEDIEWLKIGLGKYLQGTTEEKEKAFNEIKGFFIGCGVIASLPEIEGVSGDVIAKLADWWNIRAVVTKNVGREYMYAIDLAAADIKSEDSTLGIWEDIGNLKKTNDLLSAIVADRSSLARQKVRALLGIENNSADLGALVVKGAVEIDITNPDRVYLENVEIYGNGKLTIEEGVILKDVKLEVGEEGLTIKKNTKIMESDLRGVELEFIGQDKEFEAFGTVISRVFYESIPIENGRRTLNIRPDEWISTLRIRKDDIWHLALARNIISVPYTEAINKFVRDKSEWEELVAKHPEYLKQYNYDAVKDKSFHDSEDENLAGYNFSQAQKNIDYRWEYLRVLGILPLAVDDAVGFIKDKLNGSTPVIAMDIDDTFLPKKMAGISEANNLQDWRLHAYKEQKLDALYQMLSKTEVVLISGNSRAVQTLRLIEPLRDYIKGKGLDIAKMENLTVYFNGGALKITYDNNGRESLEIQNQTYSSPGDIVNDVNSNYNLAGAITPVEQQAILDKINDVFNKGKVIGWLKDKAQAAGVEYQDVISALKKYFNAEFKKRFADAGFKGNLDLSWLDGEEISIAMLNSDFVEQYTDKIPSNVTFPWFEVRDGVQIALKILPREIEINGRKIDIDIRGNIIAAIRDIAKGFNLRKGGFGSIDINKGRDKRSALSDYIGSKVMSVLYLGDEFSERGNDQPVTGIEGVQIVSVGNTAPYRDKQYSDFNWVGGGPYSTLKIFEGLGLVDFKGSLSVSGDVFLPEVIEQVKYYTDKVGKLDLFSLQKALGISRQEEVRELVNHLVANSLIGEEFFDVWNVDGENASIETGYLWDGKKIHNQDKPLWHANSHVLIVDEAGNVLITQRAADKAQFPSMWEILGGHLRTNEGFREGALREIGEELLINPNPENLRLIDDRIFFKIGRSDIGEKGYQDNIFQYHQPEKEIDGVKTPVYNYEVSKLFVYRISEAEKQSLTERLGDEVQGFEWVSVDELEGKLRGEDKNFKGFTETPYQYFQDAEFWESVKMHIANRKIIVEKSGIYGYSLVQEGSNIEFGISWPDSNTLPAGVDDEGGGEDREHSLIISSRDDQTVISWREYSAHWVTYGSGIPSRSSLSLIEKNEIRLEGRHVLSADYMKDERKIVFSVTPELYELYKLYNRTVKVPLYRAGVGIEFKVKEVPISREWYLENYKSELIDISMTAGNKIVALNKIGQIQVFDENLKLQWELRIHPMFTPLGVKVEGGMVKVAVETIDPDLPIGNDGIYRGPVYKGEIVYTIEGVKVAENIDWRTVIRAIP